ncbi:SDR family NAD(P)-dependent oxidoreductase [Streptomyces albidoflavus]
MTAPTPVPAPALTGRRCLVTGAASGIGAAIARAFLAEGAVLARTDLSLDDLDPEAGGTRHAADLTDPEAVARLAEEVLRVHGGLDVLVNCAGTLTESPLAEMELATWRQTLDADLTSVFLTCRAFLPTMVKAGHGRIVNVSSQLGQKGAANMTHYAAAKAGVIGFSRARAREVSRQGVLVNVIAPGPVVTGLIDTLGDDWRCRTKAELPLGRLGEPDEVAPTAVLLASVPGGNLYTGQTLGPNSGDVMF